MATFCFLSKDAPQYRLGYAICMGVTCVGVLATVMYEGLVVLENRRRGKGEGGVVSQKLYL